MPVFEREVNPASYDYYYPRIAVRYMGIPKSASTSVMETLRILNSGEEYKDLPSVHDVRERRKLQLNLHADANPVFSFTVVRDPIQRFVASYVDKVLSGSDFIYLANLGSMPWFPWNPKNGDEMDRLFKKFLRWVKPRLSFDGHFCGVSSFALHTKDLEVFKMTELHHLEDALSSSVGQEISFSKSNSGKQEKFIAQFLISRNFSELQELLVGEYSYLEGLGVTFGNLAEAQSQGEFSEACFQKEMSRINLKRAQVMHWGLTSKIKY